MRDLLSILAISFAVMALVISIAAWVVVNCYCGVQVPLPGGSDGKGEKSPPDLTAREYPEVNSND